MAFHDSVRQLLEALDFEGLVWLIREVYAELNKRKGESKPLASSTRASDGVSALPSFEGRSEEDLVLEVEALLAKSTPRGDALGGGQQDAITSAETFVWGRLAARVGKTRADFEDHVKTRPEALRGIAKSCGVQRDSSLPTVGSEVGPTLSACLASLSVSVALRHAHELVCACVRAHMYANRQAP